MIGEIEFYSAETDPERLTETTVYDAVVQAVGQWPDPPGPDDEIEVTSYKRMELPSRDRIADTALDHVMEWLDEEYGDPEGHYSNDSDEFREAALTFADTVRSNYQSFACEPVERFKVKVREYVPAEWIRDDTKTRAED